jgi:hypothetical protein
MELERFEELLSKVKLLIKLVRIYIVLSVENIKLGPLLVAKSTLSAIKQAIASLMTSR